MYDRHDFVNPDAEAELEAYERAFEELADSEAVRRILLDLRDPLVLGIVFSRDRAMQLDATLRSFLLHCQDAEASRLYIIYKTTDQRHARQYEHLKREYAAHDVHFIEETDFHEDVMHVLGLRGPTGQPPYILFLVDDTLFVRGFSFREIQETLIEHPEAAAFSLRLGANTTYSYAYDQPHVIPALTPIRDQIRLFDWTTEKWDFNYPLEVSSSVYRSDQIRRLFDQLAFQGPNLLEGAMRQHRPRWGVTHPALLCYEQSVAFCNPVNMVQRVVGNRAGRAPENAAGHLSKLFDQGYRIRVAAYSGFTPNACHQEVELTFEQRRSGRQGS
jgi:hypothetical protein